MYIVRHDKKKYGESVFKCDSVTGPFEFYDLACDYILSVTRKYLSTKMKKNLRIEYGTSTQYIDNSRTSHKYKIIEQTLNL